MDLKNLNDVVLMSNDLSAVNAVIALMTDRYSGEVSCSLTANSERSKCANAPIDRAAAMLVLTNEKARLEKKLTAMGVKL